MRIREPELSVAEDMAEIILFLQTHKTYTDIEAETKHADRVKMKLRRKCAEASRGVERRVHERNRRRKMCHEVVVAVSMACAILVACHHPASALMTPDYPELHVVYDMEHLTFDVPPDADEAPDVEAI